MCCNGILLCGAIILLSAMALYSQARASRGSYDPYREGFANQIVHGPAGGIAGPMPYDDESLIGTTGRIVPTLGLVSK